MNQRDNNPMPSKTRTALILGITGGIGGAVARSLAARGYAVRAMHRNPDAAARAPHAAHVDFRRGDSMNAADVRAAASGADVIVHAVNPPGYRNWQGLALPMLESTIAAARASGARILFPGTVYNFGLDAFPTITERSPQNPTTRKGAIRVAMERRLAEASRDGARTLVVRAGDFFGSGAGNSWFGQIAKPGAPLRKVVYPGRPDVGHSWAYLPDLAETMTQLLEREADLAPFEVFHFEGHWLERGIAMAEAVRSAAGGDLPIRRFPWFATLLASPFVELFREIREVRYLWEEPLRLDNTKLRGFLGREPHTPLDQAVRATLAASGCLEGGELTPARAPG